jgi:GAF domain-containing protein
MVQGRAYAQGWISAWCEPGSREAVMTTVSSERLAAIFVEVADTLVDDFDLIEFLHMLGDRAADLVGAAAAGLVMADQRGRLEFMAGSNENVKLVELFQLRTQQGPCLEAFRTGRPVINVDLRAAAPLWPRFAPWAAAAGFQSVHAFPLRAHGQVIGAMNVFGATKGGDFTGADVPIMQALADVAAIALLQERAVRRGEALTEQLQGALDSRIVIEQAKGAVAQAKGITVDEAFDIIRSYARCHNRKLTDIARALVTNSALLTQVVSRGAP